jgi:hypothetical protein
MKPEELYDPSMTRFEWFARRNRRTLRRIRRFVRGPLLGLLIVGPLLWFGLFHTNASPVVTVRPPKRSVAKTSVTTTIAGLPTGPVLAVSGKPAGTRVYRSRVTRRRRYRRG